MMNKRTYRSKSTLKENIKPIQGIQNLCRLCLGEAKDSVPIFADKNDICSSLATRIMMCVGYEVRTWLSWFTQTFSDVLLKMRSIFYKHLWEHNYWHEGSKFFWCCHLNYNVQVCEYLIQWPLYSLIKFWFKIIRTRIYPNQCRYSVNIKCMKINKRTTWYKLLLLYQDDNKIFLYKTTKT